MRIAIVTLPRTGGTNFAVFLEKKVTFNQGDATSQNFLITALAMPVPA